MSDPIIAAVEADIKTVEGKLATVAGPVIAEVLTKVEPVLAVVAPGLTPAGGPTVSVTGAVALLGKAIGSSTFGGVSLIGRGIKAVIMFLVQERTLIAVGASAAATYFKLF